MKKLLILLLCLVSLKSVSQTWYTTGTANLQRTPTAKGWFYRNNMGSLGNVTWYTAPQLDSLLAIASTGWVPTTRLVSTTSPLQGGGNLASNLSLSILQSSTSQSGYLSNTDWNTFNNKEASITAGTILQYWRGDKTFQTLNTAAVPELTNLYYTNARGIGSTLTGYTSGAGTISSADNVLQAIQKLNGNISGLVTGVSSFNTRTGAIALTSGDVTTALTFTPENVANKTATQSSSTTTYPNWLGVTNYAAPITGGGNYIQNLYSNITSTQATSRVSISGGVNSNYETPESYINVGDTLSTSATKNAVHFGTSITQGLGVAFVQYGFAFLWDYRTGAVSINKGLSGSSMVPYSGHVADAMINRVSEIPTYASTYSMLSFEYGTNDAANSLDTAVFRANYKTVLDSAITRRGWPKNKIIVVLPTYNTAAYAASVPTFIRIAREVALLKGVKPVDTYTLLQNNGGSANLADGIHPNYLGTKLMVQAILDTVIYKSTGNIHAFGNIRAMGNGYIDGTLTVGGNMTSNLVPNLTNTWNLGSSSQRWGTIYGTDLSATGNVTLGNITGGSFTGGSVTPTANNTSNLGASSFRYGTIYGTNIDAAGTVTGSSFSGAGTGLTGTASSLNIGGNAATATTATTASTVTTNANLTGAITSVGNAASLGSFTSANLRTALTDESGTGAAIFAGSPTFTGTISTGNIQPTTNNASNFGTSSLRYGTSYFNVMNIAGAITSTSNATFDGLGDFGGGAIARGANGNYAGFKVSNSGGTAHWGMLELIGGSGQQGDFLLYDLPANVPLLTIAKTTGNAIFAGSAAMGGVVNLKSYTVATLPAGTQGDEAYVTDATAPTYLGALTGGGAVKCPVFYNGSAWVSH